MLNPQQEQEQEQDSSEQDFTTFFQSINPAINPNLNQCFPQPVLPPEFQSSRDGDDDLRGGFEGQITGIKREIIVEMDDWSTTDDAVSNPMGVNTAISLGLCNSGSSAIEDQNMVPEGTKVSQLMRCEICDIDFNSSIVYKEHISGKKHKKKYEMLNNMNIPAGSAVAEAIKAAIAEGLEPKRQKLIEGSWKVVFMRFCTMCDVVCNTQEMYEKHLAGKKHAAQARKQAQDVKELSVAANPDSTSGVDPVVLPEDHNTSNPNKTCTGQFAWCEVCSISCTSEDILGIHKQGKKHLKNMKKAKMIASDPLPGQMEELSLGITDKSKIANSDDSHAMIEDSEIKKQEIMEGSVEGSKVPNFVPEGSVEKSKLSDFIPEKIPTILPKDMKNGGTKGVGENKGIPKIASCDACNINCTSEDLLVIHKLGRKHLKKLERLRTETSSSIPTPIDVPASMVPETSPTNYLKIGNVTKSHGLEEDSEMKSAIVEDNRKEDKVEKSAADLGFVCETSPTFCPLENKSGRHEIDPEKVNSDEFVSKNSDNKTDTISADQFARCEVCNIYCNSKDVLANHKLGKKHLKNLEKLKTNNPSDLHLQANQVKTDDLKNRNAINLQIPKTSSDMMEPEVTGIEEVGGAFRYRSNSEDIETKKRKILEGILKEYEVEKPAAVNLNSVHGVNPTALPDENKNDMIRIEPSKINIDEEGSENPDKKISDQFAWCEVCNVYCNSEDVLTVHKSGKKHLKNMMKGGPLNVQANQESHDDQKTQTVIESQRPNKELEKIMKPEVPLIQDVGGSLRLCTLCNVVCNSQIVLDSHVAGQKHVSLMRKVGTSSTGYRFAVAR